MSTSVKIDLSKSYEWFDKSVSTIYVKPPRAGLALRFGDPYFYVHMPDGAYYIVDRDDVIQKYLDQLLSHDGENPMDGGGAAFLEHLTLVDLFEIKDALHGFFTEAGLKVSLKKRTASSSTLKS